VVLVIAAGLLLLVAGETRFDLVGFLVVMGASMLAGFRWTITQVLLQGDASGHTSAQLLYSWLQWQEDCCTDVHTTQPPTSRQYRRCWK
jgi:solute carrier family 35, member C2